MNLNEKSKNIKLLLLDVDGVLTDGSIILGDSNQETKIFNVKDGLGIKLAQAGGIEIGIITGHTSEAVKKRADELDIKILNHGQPDKLEVYEQIKNDLVLKDEQIAYVGDDLSDLKVLQKVGFSIAVNDACDDVKAEADYITKSSGGKGAVREVIELILKSQGKWQALIQKYYGT
ncbi:MAG: HAD-IIIA family hydrolase [bacterium]|nr:MAG: HAD-IIIA family hydrolase [bacterium]